MTDNDSRECLDFLLSHIVPNHVRVLLRGCTLHYWLLSALREENPVYQRDTARVLKVYEMQIGKRHPDGYLYIKNNGVMISRLFEKTKWRDGDWMYALRALEGAGPTMPMKIAGISSRATRIPIRHLTGASLPTPKEEEPMPQIMTRKQLDVMQCQMPGCDHKNHSTIHFFHSRCHTDADCEVSYDNQLGMIRIDCGECGRNICMVEVAAG
jgi:hypothetical protein